MNIPITKVVFNNDDLQAIIKPLESGWVVQGPQVKEFEKKWSEFTKAKNSIAVSNCTTALHLSLAALDIKFGDEVIVPAFTWVATVNAILYQSATPVFCDIDINTFNIDINKIESLITKKTKAIIPVHLFGLSADMDPIIEISKKHNLYIIEDCACGFNARYKGIHVGNFGTTGCFSFHPRKAITTGEGGMITTNDNLLTEKLRAMRDHGATISDHNRHLTQKPYLLPDFPYLGYNYRMTDIQASIGITQMNRASTIAEKRIQIAKQYNENLKTIDWLKKPYQNQDYNHGYQSYVCLFEPEKITKDNVKLINSKRNEFMDYLQKNGISTRPGTHAVHMLEYYRKRFNIRPDDYLNSYIADNCSIALPLYPTLSSEELYYIIDTIHNFKYQ